MMLHEHSPNYSRMDNRLLHPVRKTEILCLVLRRLSSGISTMFRICHDELSVSWTIWARQLLMDRLYL